MVGETLLALPQLLLLFCEFIDILAQLFFSGHEFLVEFPQFLVLVHERPFRPVEGMADLGRTTARQWTLLRSINVTMLYRDYDRVGDDGTRTR